MSKKRGKLHTDELNFIRRNVIEMPDEDIAKHLNRSVELVARVVLAEGLRPQQSKEETATRNRLMQELHSKQYWSILQKQFNNDELASFEGSWVDIQIQFKEDMLPSEELQLKQFLTTNISMDRTMIERRNNLHNAEFLDERLNAEYKKPSEERDIELMTSLATQISAAKASVTTYTNEFTKLADFYKNLQKELRASRADRIKRIEDSKASWQGVLRLLEDEEKLVEFGEEAELFKIAAQKRAKKLAEWHEFEDGKVDQPLLDVEYLQDDKEDFEDGLIGTDETD